MKSLIQIAVMQSNITVAWLTTQDNLSFIYAATILTINSITLIILNKPKPPKPWPPEFSQN